MGTGEFNAGGNPAMDWHPIQGGVEIFLVASCHGNRDKLRPGGPLGSYADFFFFFSRSSNFVTRLFFFLPVLWSEAEAERRQTQHGSEARAVLSSGLTHQACQLYDLSC